MSVLTHEGAVAGAGTREAAARERREGMRAMAPMLVALVPFAVVVGTAVAQSDHRLAAWLGTSTIYGGAAHLAVLDLVSDGAGWVSAAAVGLLINVRLAAFATSMVPEWRSASLRQRLAAGVMLTDIPWALSRDRRGQRQFYLGAALTLFLAWPVMVTTGMLLGEWLAELSVTAILPALSLGALVMTRVRARPIAFAVTAAAAAAVATAGQPASVALVICSIVGRGRRLHRRKVAVMTVLLAVLVVGMGSLLLRVVPLMGARRLPDRVAAYAEYAGMAVLAAIVVRAVMLHRDADVPGAPLVALVSTACGLVVAYRGRSVLASVAAGAATYLAITAALAVTT